MNHATKHLLEEAATELEIILKDGYAQGREGPPRVHRLVSKLREHLPVKPVMLRILAEETATRFSIGHTKDGHEVVMMRPAYWRNIQQYVKDLDAWWADTYVAYKPLTVEPPKEPKKNSSILRWLDMSQSPPYFRYDTEDRTAKENESELYDIQEELRSLGFTLVDTLVEHDCITGTLSKLEDIAGQAQIANKTTEGE